MACILPMVRIANSTTSGDAPPETSHQVTPKHHQYHRSYEGQYGRAQTKTVFQMVRYLRKINGFQEFKNAKHTQDLDQLDDLKVFKGYGRG